MSDAQDSFVSWMVAGGARLDDPDPRNLAHLVALREAQRADRRLSPLAWLAARVGLASPAIVATDPQTQCCAA